MPISAHPSHTSWPHWGAPPKAPVATCQFRHTPHTLRGPIGSFTQGPSGHVRMRLTAHRMLICAHLHTLRGPVGSPTQGPSGHVRMRLPAHRMPISAHPSHTSRPHRELHPRPQ
eukprot:4215495-Pyramimonas_sp.AAC.1